MLANINPTNVYVKKCNAPFSSQGPQGVELGYFIHQTMPVMQHNKNKIKLTTAIDFKTINTTKHLQSI